MSEDVHGCFPMRTCNSCSRALLPSTVDIHQSGVLDSIGDTNRRHCAEHLRELANKGVTVKVSNEAFQDAVKRGCVVCRALNDECSGFHSRDLFTITNNPSEAIKKTFYTSLSIDKATGKETDSGDQPLSHSFSDIVWFRVHCHITPPHILSVWVEFKVSAQESSLSSRTISSRSSHNTTLALERARAMAKVCVETHPCCGITGIPQLPARVIEVGLHDAASVRILVTQGHCGHYAALSYCWGKGEQTLLKKNNLNAMQNGTPLGELPRTIIDAVHTTRRLGLPFLWVDALCILQDDEDDKAREISSMHTIFSRAYVTLAATAGTDCEQGFLVDPPSNSEHHEPSAAIYYPCIADNRVATIGINASRYLQTFEQPLNRRAWALQETALSPRLLSFTSHQTCWHCRDVPFMLGDGPYKISNDPAKDGVTTAMDFVNNADRAREYQVEVTYYYWHSAVAKDYAERELTDESDRLPALAGIAAYFQKALNDTYLVGLWEGRLIQMLAWYWDTPRRYDPEWRPRASWSWVFTRGKVCYQWHYFDADPVNGTTLVSHDIKVVNENVPLSKIEYGILKLRGRLGSIQWDGYKKIRFSTERVIADVYPDWQRMSLMDQTEQTNMFYMMYDEPRLNKAPCSVRVLPTSAYIALLLYETKKESGRFIRLGALSFEDADELERLAAGWEEEVIELE